MDDIEKNILEIFKGITKEYLDKKIIDTAWLTKEIKKRVGILGEREGNLVASTIHDGEWLYDLVWFRNDAFGRMTDVPLVLESELSDKSLQGLQFDFEKLLLANSPIKVFICLVNAKEEHPNSVKNLTKFFSERFKAFKPQNKRLLLLFWDDCITGNVVYHQLSN